LKPARAARAHDHRKTRDWIRRAGGLHRRASGTLRGLLGCDRRAYLSQHGGTRHSMPKKQDYVKVDEPLVDRARKLANGVHAPIEAWDEYQRRYPSLKMDQIRWRSMNGFPAGSAMPEIRCFRPWPAPWHAGNVPALRPVRHFGVYGCTRTTHDQQDRCGSAANRADVQTIRLHFGTIPLDIAGNSPQHDVKGTVGVDKGKTSLGQRHHTRSMRRRP